MNATLNVATKVLAFLDSQVSSNPRLRAVDWTRDLSGIAVEDPRSQALRLDAGTSQTIFDGTRTLTVDNTTAFSLTLSTLDAATRYRLARTAGTAPGFRTDRSLTPAGMTFTLVATANATLTVASSAPVFGAVVSGDQVFIPGLTTGDAAGPFNVQNAGFWTVLSAPDSQHLTLVRPAGTDFEGVSEVVTVVANTDFQACTAAGVQVGDVLDLLSGFSVATSFNIVAVTAGWVEFSSSVPLANETGVIPTASGIAIYSDLRNFLYLESSQEIAVRLNGDTGSTQRVQPLDASDPTRPGVFMKWGPAFKLVVVNRSASAADILVIHAK